MGLCWVLPQPIHFLDLPGFSGPLSNPIFSQTRQTGLYGPHLSPYCACLKVEAPPLVPSQLLQGMGPAEEVLLHLTPNNRVLWAPRGDWKAGVNLLGGQCFHLQGSV